MNHRADAFSYVVPVSRAEFEMFLAMRRESGRRIDRAFEVPLQLISPEYANVIPFDRGLREIVRRNRQGRNPRA